MNIHSIKFLSLLAFVGSINSCGLDSNRKSNSLSSTMSFGERNQAILGATIAREPRRIVSNSQEFKCLLGRLSWLGRLNVEFRLSGFFDENRKLVRVRMAHLPGAPTRYDVEQQSEIDPLSSNMLSLQLVHEDNAAYYESHVTVSNKKFQGSTEAFDIHDASPENFYMSKYVWRDLHQNESTGMGVCYIAPAG